VAVGHAILVIAFHLLRDGTADHDLGPNPFDHQDRQRVERRSVHRLRDLGYRLTREPVAAD
jgi:transposase